MEAPGSVEGLEGVVCMSDDERRKRIMSLAVKQTDRAHLAGEALAAMQIPVRGGPRPERLAKRAVRIADAVLDELERTESMGSPGQR